MPTWLTVTLLTLMAGMTMPLGAIIASIEHIHRDWLEQEFRHSVMAFGGGALFSAVALVLVPEGTEELPAHFSVLWIVLGGLIFCGLDILLARYHSPTTQLVAMLSDFIPEALALGATFSAGGKSGPLLAILIALQNLPEGFNAYREMNQGPGISGVRIVVVFGVLALLGPIAGLGGFLLLAQFPAVVAAIKLVASGGILFLVFQDIAPQARLEKAWAPALGAVLGFALGVLGHELLP
ncbi:divalent cation transporter [Blastopirellula marina]|uniref:Divalent cation transporter n=2 Tax=Pirellulales TaxID=2691354 RepID=A0A2S8FD38_9BACT|nr:divalent cation transporter [Blastopirellula marina]RCS50477.1 divalent cation transporter [Bremerella cremea]